MQAARCSSNSSGKLEVLSTSKLIVCINRRLGYLRKIAFPNEHSFEGDIVYGVGDAASGMDFNSHAVLIVGAGAFAAENTRTALEHGAERVSVLQRRRGAVCPLIVDYLNFARPYALDLKHD